MQPRAHLCIAFRLCGKGERKVLGAKSLQSCPTIRDPKDCSPPGFSVQRILQARILDWVDMPSSQENPRALGYQWKTHIELCEYICLMDFVCLT